MPKPTKAPAFRFYPKDFLTSERQIAMSAAAAGVYIRLLCHCWLSDSLPNDLAILAKLSGVDDAEFATIWPLVSPSFLSNKVGRLVHPRLMHEQKKQLDYSKSQRTSGLRGAQKRWARHSDPIGVATDSPMAKNGSSSSFPSSFPEEKTNTRPNDPAEDRDEGFDRFWALYPSKKGKKAAWQEWRRLKPSQTFADLILAAVQIQVRWPDWTRDGGRYIPNPATWLHQGRWDDEPKRGVRPDGGANPMPVSSWECLHDPPCEAGTTQFRCHQRSILEANRATA